MSTLKELHQLLSDVESGQPIAKVTERIEALIRKAAGPELIRVEFFAPREDLLALFKSEEYASRLEEDPETMQTDSLLLNVLQWALYDSKDGPQMTGDFKILEDSEENYVET